MVKPPPGMPGYLPGKGGEKLREITTDYPREDPVPIITGTWYDPPKIEIDPLALPQDFDEHSARKEHINPGLEMYFCGPLDEVLQKYGYGYYVYFDFIRVLLCLGILLFILQLIPYIWYVSEESPGFSEDKSGNLTVLGYRHFFISEYTSSEKAVWYIANISCIVLSAITVLLFERRTALKREKCIDDGLIPADGLERQQEDMILRYKKIDTTESGSGSTTVEDCIQNWTMFSVALRFFAAFFMFAMMITVTIVVSYYSTRINRDGTALISGLLSILVQVLNAIYLFVAHETTLALPISSWTTFTKVYIAKMVLFRVSQTMALFITKSYEGECAYYLIGEQFMFLMLTELTIGNLIEVIAPLIAAQIKRVVYRHTDLLVGFTEADLLPRFEIAVEYLELFGRQYYLYMAMIVFPLASFLNILSLLADYWLDKWRLMRISAKQRSRLLKTQRRFLSFVLLLSIILSLVTPWAGVVWVLSGLTADACTECSECSFP